MFAKVMVFDKTTCFVEYDLTDLGNESCLFHNHFFLDIRIFELKK